MSTQSKKHDFLKSLTQYVSGPRYYAEEIKLSAPDLQTVVGCMKFFYCILVDVRSSWGLTTPFASIRNLISAGNGGYVKAILSQLDAADALLISTCEQNHKRFSYVEEGCSTFLKKLQSLMQPIITAWNTSHDVEAFKSLHQVNTFMKRLSLQEVDELKLVAFDGWYETEKRDWNYELLSSEEKRVLAEWFPVTAKTRAYATAKPSHGTGSTAEGYTNIEDKCLNLRWTHDAVTLVKDVGREDLLPRNDNSLMQSLTVSDDWLAPVAAYDYCVVCFVNKSWKTFRVISMESVNTMYWQQFVGDAFEIWLRSGKCGMSAHYCIDTEWINREYAEIGSIGGEYDTLDLSSASDCVGFDLVLDGFQETFLNTGLMLTRSAYAVFEDPRSDEGFNALIQKKYAPMGNRLCFPTMTAILCAVCEAVVRRHTGTPASPEDYAVYGDDIVIRHQYVAEVIARLTALGFVLNARKSYYRDDTDMYYRESCGGEYLNGTDVTPLMISREFHGLASVNRDAYDPAVLGSLVEFANRVFEYRFSTLRLLLTFIIDRATNKQVWRDDGTEGLFSPQATNRQLDSRGWNEDLQVMQALALSLKRRIRRTTLHSNVFEASTTYGTDEGLAPILLHEYLMLTERRERLLYPEDRVTITYDPYRSPEITVVLHNLPD